MSDHEEARQPGTQFMYKAPASLLLGVLDRLEQRKVYLSAEKSVSALVEAASHQHWEVRAAALRSLGRLGEQAPLAVLVAALQDEHRLVRVAAIGALSQMGERTPLEQFVRALHDPDWEVREMVVLVLGGLDEQTARPLLLAASQDRDSRVREAADYALQTLEAAPLPVARLADVPLPTRKSFVLKHLWLVFSRQIPIMRKSIWVTSVLIMFLGGVALLLSTSLYTRTLWLTHAEWILTVAMSTASAIGAAQLYGEENDAGHELTFATPTSMRTVLLSRMALIVLYSILLGAVASASITAIYGGSFWEMLQLWVGPVLLLSALSLALSMVIGSLLAILASLVLEATQMLAFTPGKGLPMLHITHSSVWQTTPALLTMALLLLLLALFYAPRYVRLSQ